MSIKYIKENIKKFDHDNLISFLFDIVIRGGLDNVEDFDETKSYVENEKVGIITPLIYEKNFAKPCYNLFNSMWF